jgi:hypothetical protein
MHLVGDDLPVGDLGAVAVGLEDHLDADVHPRSSLLVRLPLTSLKGMRASRVGPSIAMRTFRTR